VHRGAAAIAAEKLPGAPEARLVGRLTMEHARETAEAEPAARTAPLGSAGPGSAVAQLLSLQRSAGNRAVTRAVTATRSVARLIGRPPANGAPATVAYPPDLLAACPSLATSGPAETDVGRPSLEALAGAAGTVAVKKDALDKAKKTLFGRDLSPQVGRDALNKIASSTAVADVDKDPEGHAARDSALLVQRVLGAHADHMSQIREQTTLVEADNEALQNANLKLKVLQEQLQRASYQDEKSKLEQDQFLGFVGTAISQLGQGIFGEEWKLLTAKLLEGSAATKNPDAGKGKPGAQGTLLAMGLEDLAAGAGGLLFLFDNALGSLADKITGVEKRKDDLNDKIKKLTIAINNDAWRAAIAEIQIVAKQLRAREGRLADLKATLLSDKRELEDALASLAVDVDKKAGVDVFAKTRAGLDAAGAADAAADGTAAAIDALKAACPPAESALANPVQLPTVPPPPPYDGSQAAAEVHALGAAQDAASQAIADDKAAIATARSQLETRLSSAFAAAASGL
jgi:hypothetical protein